MGKVAFVFPGQGSQTVGMGKDLFDHVPAARNIFEKADETLSFPLSKLIFEGPNEELTLTYNAQPALLTTSIALLQLFKEEGITPDFTAGHSLGEYTALVCANSITFEDGVFAVRKRGELMEEAVPSGEGTMAAVLGLDRERLTEVAVNVNGEGTEVDLANINCPGQIVISGSRKGVELASEKAKEAGAKRVIPLNVSGPFHSRLMKPAAEKFKAVLDEIEIKEAEIPVIGNVTASKMTSPTEINEKLIEQLYSPVLWEDSVKTLIDLGVDTFVEIGPGKVLTGLIRKVSRSVKTYNVFDQDSYQLTVNALKEGQE